MAEFSNFRRKYSPSALMQGVQQQNQQRYMSPAITPNVGMGNAQGRTSALAPAAGMSTSNPTGAQTMGPVSNPGAFTQQDYDEYIKQQTGVSKMPGAQNLLNVKVPEHLKQFAPSGKPQTLPYQMPSPGTQPSATVPVEFYANGTAPASAPVTTPQSRTPSMPGGQVPRASALAGIDMSPRFTNALSPYDGAGAGSAGGSGAGNLGMSPAPAPASPPAASVLVAPTSRTSPMMQQDTGGYENMNPLFTGGPESGNMFPVPAEPSTIDRLRAAGRGEGPNAQAGQRVDDNRYNKAYDDQYQGIQAGQGITSDDKANWTPEKGYGFAPSAVQSAASGGAIGAGMRKRFGEGGYFNPPEEDTGPQRRMSDAESMQKMGIIVGAKGPDGRRLGFSKIDQAIARGDTATAEKLKQEQDATRERNFARREALRGVNGGKTHDELRREKRANSALSRGRITTEEYNNVVTRNDESVERRSALRDAGIPVRGDRGFDAIDRANGSSAPPRTSALAGVPTASGLPDTATQQKAAAKIDALTNPEAPAPTAVGPQGQQDALKRDMAMSVGLKPDMDQEGVRGTLETIPEENLMNIANDPAAARAFVETYKEFDAAQKSVKKDYEKPFDNSQSIFDTNVHQLQKNIAAHMLKMNTLPANDPEAYQKWMMELIRMRQKARTDSRSLSLSEGTPYIPDNVPFGS